MSFWTSIAQSTISFPEEAFCSCDQVPPMLEAFSTYLWIPWGARPPFTLLHNPTSLLLHFLLPDPGKACTVLRVTRDLKQPRGNTKVPRWNFVDRTLFLPRLQYVSTQNSSLYLEYHLCPLQLCPLDNLPFLLQGSFKDFLLWRDFSVSLPTMRPLCSGLPYYFIEIPHYILYL